MVFRPALPPGALLTRHDATQLRIGQRPGVLVRDSPTMRALVAHVDGILDADTVCDAVAQQLDMTRAEVDRHLDELVRSGAVVDAGPWARIRAPRDEVFACLLRGGSPQVIEQRTRTRAVVVSSVACGALADLVRGSLNASGVALRTDRAPGRARDRPEVSTPDIVVVISLGEPPRDEIASHRHVGTRVLPVGLAEGRAVVGPWIDPGRTPCLTCAHLTRLEWEPGWSGHWPSLDRSDRPHGVGVELHLVLAGLIVADVLAAIDGRRPRTTGARLMLGPDPAAVSRHEIDFHPACTCHLLTFDDEDAAVS